MKRSLTTWFTAALAAGLFTACPQPGNDDDDDDSAPPALTEIATVTALDYSAVASNPWATPVHVGSAFGSAAFYRVEGNALVAYELADLDNGSATELARVSFQPGGETSDVSGLAVISFGGSPERLFFYYGKADFSGGLGSATFDGSAFAAVETEIATLATSTNFPLRRAGNYLAAIDDMMGAVLSFDVGSYSGGSLSATSLTTSGCSGLPVSHFLGAAYALDGNRVGVTYTGGMSSSDEGKGGFLVFDLGAVEGSACLQHVFLAEGSEADSHVAVGGLALADGALYGLWDHYGGGYPAPRYPSMVQLYEYSAGTVGDVIGEAAVAAPYPTAIFAAGGQLVVMETPTDAPLGIELFSFQLEALDRVTGADGNDYGGAFYGVQQVNSDGSFWIGTPDGLTKFEL